MLARVASEIAQNHGWISFARYMELALHAPGGYYAGGARKFGAEGDFVTAPELGRLFGRTLARQFRDLPFQRVLEVGAGSGALAETLVAELNCEYVILETSPELRDRQRIRLKDNVRLKDKVRWIDSLPQRFRGVIVANEVVDAMPVHAVAWTAQGIREQAKAISPPIPYESEIGLAGQAWMRTLAERLEEGVIFVVDYGFPRHEYYHPQRAAGTLMCHHRHRAHGDVFARPGLEDMTAHVDFSALAGAAREGGLEVLGYATQAQFLVNCGITDVLGQANVENALHYAPLAAQANKLLSPAEMGELFKVLAVGRGVKRPLLGFSHGDRSHTL